MKNDRESGRCVVVHGGAGIVRAETHFKVPYLGQAADAAWAALEDGAPGEEAVVAALRVMEDCQYFNAGYGGYPNNHGIVLLDVGLMRGNRDFVSLLNVRRLKYPSAAALDLMRQGRFRMSVWTHELLQMVESASDEVKERYGYVRSHDDLLAPFVRELMEKRAGELLADEGKGTVGCVVRDAAGRLFAGTSTGGVSFKSNGRIGDSPIIGSGVYADDSVGALSTSGHGEAALATGFSGFLLSRLRGEHRKDKAQFSSNPELLHQILQDELGEFSRKAPSNCLGVIVIPPLGRPSYSVYGGTFAVGKREEGDVQSDAELIVARL